MIFNHEFLNSIEFVASITIIIRQTDRFKPEFCFAAACSHMNVRRFSVLITIEKEPIRAISEERLA